MTNADLVEEIDQSDVTLTEAVLGYDIRVAGETAGSIEGVPGRIEYLVVEPHWEGRGVGRAALHEFISLSKAQGISEVTTNNATHPAMKHILETEDFQHQEDGTGWEKEVV